MGTGEKASLRIKLQEEDFPILERKTLEIQNLFLNLFSCRELEVNNWPHRYLTSNGNNEYELIFSQMGSVTLRTAPNATFRRNPPPIFYMSLGKYVKGFSWEDFNADEIDTSPENLKNLILEKMDFFEKNQV